MGTVIETHLSQSPVTCTSHLVLKTIMQSQVVFIFIFLISGILTESFLVEVEDSTPSEPYVQPDQLKPFVKPVQPEPYGTEGYSAPQPYGAGKGGDDYFQGILRAIADAIKGRRRK